MNKTEEIVEANREWLDKSLPVHPSLDRLIVRTDCIIFKGINRIEEILDTETDPKNLIMANNSIIATGRYLEMRRLNESNESNKLNYDDKDLILTDAT